MQMCHIACDSELPPHEHIAAAQRPAKPPTSLVSFKKRASKLEEVKLSRFSVSVYQSPDPLRGHRFLAENPKETLAPGGDAIPA
jgi:hypothetical protein